MSVDELVDALRASMPEGLERESDWDDVLRRAVVAPTPRKGARRGRVPGGLAVALVVVGGAAALGAPRLLAPTRVAPTVATVERDLRGHLVGERVTGVGLDPRVIPGSTRLVTSIPVAGGGTARLYVARTRRGLPCFSTTGRPFGRSGCQLASDPRLLWARFGTWKPRASIRHTVVGRAAPRATRSVVVVYRGGTRQLVWHVVDGWFLAELRRGHNVPVALVARSAGGTVLARTPVQVSFGPGHAPLLIRCVRVLGGHRTCPTPPRARRPIRPRPPPAVPAWARSLPFVVPVRQGGRDCVRVRPLLARPTLTWTVACFGHIGRQGLGARLVLRDGTGFVVGRIGSGIARLTVRYADGDRSSVMQGRRDYSVPLPAWRWHGPHRPVAVIAYDRTGTVVAHRSIPAA